MFKRMVILCVGILCAVVFVAALKSKRKLPDGCTPVLTADNSNTTPDYWWLSNRVMLVYRFNPGWSNSSNDRGKFWLHNVVSGADKYLPNLTRDFNAVGAYAYEAKLSPDNRWLMWKTRRWPLPYLDRSAITQPVYRILDGPRVGEESDHTQTHISVVPAGNITGRVNGVRKTFKFNLPVCGEILETAYSRSGDQIAWVIACGGRMLTINGVWIPVLDKEVQLWVSNSDGSNARELGYDSYPISEACDHGTSSGADPKSVHWLPDGRHVSFMCENEVYMMPTE
jgi:hypothetical protein